MTKARGRGITVVALLAVAGVAAVATVWYFRQRPAGEPPASPAVTEATLSISETPFTPWVKFENLGQHSGLFERYYVDLTLGHQIFKLLPSGLPPQRARLLLLDDDDLLLPSGRKLWNRELLAQPGMVGKFCYVHSDFCPKRLFEIFFVVDGEPIVVYDNYYTIERFPSRTVMRYRFAGVGIDEHKYITDDDRAVSSFHMRSFDNQEHTVSFEVVAYNPPVPRSVGLTEYPLLAQGEYRERPLYLYLDAPGFERRAGFPVRLERTVKVGAAEPTRVNVAVSFENAARTNGAPLPEDILEKHVATYQTWFADNVPYFDCPDAAIKKMWYYRWWIVRFHRVAPETSDLQGWAFYEGMLGFDNLISFAAPAQLEELGYLRDPAYGLDQARNSYRNRSDVGALMDAPGSPYWGEMYSQWTAAAVADFHRVHRIEPATLRELLHGMASDVRAWMQSFDTDGDHLPSREIPRITGYDLDILSWWHFNDLKVDLYRRPPALERVDFASFVYANARAVAELAGERGRPRRRRRREGVRPGGGRDPRRGSRAPVGSGDALLLPAPVRRPRAHPDSRAARFVSVHDAPGAG